MSRHFSLSFIASGRSSELHPVSSHNCCMYVRAGRPAFARPYVRVHRSASLMSSSLVLQLCPACLVRLTWIVFLMVRMWPCSWCLVGCCCQDLFNIAHLHTCVCVCVDKCVTVSMGLLFPQIHMCGFSSEGCGLWSLATTCRVPIVGKRPSHASSLCVRVRYLLPSIVVVPLCLVVELVN